jgi:hypothetical protein
MDSKLPVSSSSPWPIASALVIGFLAGAVFVALLKQPATAAPQPPPAPEPIGYPLPTGDPIPAFDVAPRATLDIHATRVSPGGNVVVSVRTSAPLPRDAWVGIIPSHIPHGDEAINDRHDLAYQYMEGRSRVTMIFRAPLEPGRYDLRLHSTDSNGVELASGAFEVVGY